MQKVLVIGLGRFGTALVETLWESGVEVLVVDEIAAAVDAVKSHAGAAFVGDGTDMQVLHAIGAADVDTAIVTFGEDFEASVLCVSGLKSLGVKDIVARAATQRQRGVLEAVGASRVVQIELEMGHRVAIELVTPVANDLLELAHGVAVIPWIACGKVIGQTLQEADLRRKYEISVLGYRASGEAREPRGRPKVELPGADYRIARGDTLLLAGQQAQVARFMDDCQER